MLLHLFYMYIVISAGRFIQNHRRGLVDLRLGRDHPLRESRVPLVRLRSLEQVGDH